MLKPPSTARTAGRSDWAERRFRRQPFILLSFSSSKKARKAPKGSPQNSHTARSITDYKRCHFHSHSSISVLLWTFSHKRRTFAFTSESGYVPHHRQQNRTQRLTRRNRGVSDGAAITTLDTYCTFTNIPGPGIRMAYFAAFGSWPGVLSKNAESLRDSDALMRVAVPRRRGPAGLRDLFATW